MEQNSSHTTQKILASIAVLLVTVLTVFGVKAFDSKKVSATSPEPIYKSSVVSNPVDATTNTAAEPATSAATATTTSDSYKDGTYEATTSYGTPGGTESIKVSLTINGGSISSSTVTPQASSRDSREYQSAFIDGYKSQVTGKPLKNLSLSRVSGASLTTQGFNDALDQIRAKAAV